MRSVWTRGSLAGLAVLIVAVTPAQAQRSGWTSETIFEQGFDLPSAGGLVVDVGDMDVRIEAGAAARVEVIGHAEDLTHARDIFERMRFSASANGRTLTVETDEPRNLISWQDWQNGRGASFEAIITVPSRIDVNVKTGDGDVALASVEGRVDVHTGDGDVTLGSVSGPRVSLSTGDGDVKAMGISAGTIELDTGDGDLIVEDVAGQLTAKTGDGDVSLDISRFDGVSVRTGDGDVTVFADPSIRATLDVSGEDLSLARAFTISGTLEEDRLEGTLNGGGPELRIRTGDGSVAIRDR